MFVFNRKSIKFSPNGEGGAGAPAGGQAPPPAGGQEPQNPPGAGGTPPGQAPGSVKTADEYEKMLTELRTENGNHRTKNKELQKFKDDAEAATKTETEKLQQKATDAESKAAKAAERALKTEIKLAATDAKIVDAEAAYALLDKSKIVLDDDGQPTNLSELMADLVKTKSYLLAPQGGNGHSPSNPGAQGRGGSLTLAQLKTMTAAQVAALPEAEVARVLSGK